ncbi:MAG TPA: multicopper oxidase domain-containing protein [Patescibacteria group bacterium]|nr:multicopper oxidase domain-containing protein [Patescibacteria group bacterium]
MRHTINRKLFEMERVDQYVRPGELEIWEFENTSDDMWHPMHIHNVQFQILSRNGSSDIALHERGWKDTVLVNQSEKVQLLVKFSEENEGLYLMHCHILEHEDEGMMMNFLLSSTVSVEKQVGENTFSIMPNPASEESRIAFNEAAYPRELSIREVTGKTVYSATILPGTAEYTFNIRHLPVGNYYCTIGMQTIQFVISR